MLVNEPGRRSRRLLSESAVPTFDLASTLARGLPSSCTVDCASLQLIRVRGSPAQLCLQRIVLDQWKANSNESRTVVFLSLQVFMYILGA